MSSINHITLIGNMTTDPDIRVTTNGLSVAKFTLAVDRPETTSAQTTTDFLTVVAWRDLAETIKVKGKKGRLVLIEGRIASRSYDDAEGKRHYVTEIDAKEFKALDKQVISGSQESDRPSASSVVEKEEAQLKESEFDFGSVQGAEFEGELEESVPF